MREDCVFVFMRHLVILIPQALKVFTRCGLAIGVSAFSETTFPDVD